MGDPQLPRPLLTPAGFLLDLDGTLYTDAGPIPGGPAALEALRHRGIPFRCVTNTTSRSRAGLVERLASLGYDVTREEIISPASAAVGVCQARGLTRVVSLVPEAVVPDLAGLTLLPPDAAEAQAVLLGDLGERWTFALLQRAFALVLGGAAMIALSRDRFFQSQGTLLLDAGPFVAALEYATSRTAAVVGKPSADFYRAALASLGQGTDGVVMVGDDLWSDIQGAQNAGLRAWLVRTGKFREETLRESGISPDRVIGSAAEIGGSEK